MGELEDVKESLSKLWDRVWMGPDNHHRRIGDLKNRVDDFFTLTLPSIWDAIKATANDIKSTANDLRLFQVRILGNGEKGFVDKKIDERLEGFEEAMSDMITEAIRVAFEKKAEQEAEAQEKQEDKVDQKRTIWSARGWTLVIVLIQFLLSLYLAFWRS
jgi:DNA-binding protein YbaB